MDLDAARHFLVALLIGALVGIEREKRKGVAPGHAFGGIRTFILLALAGAASAWIAREMAQPWAFVVTLAVVGAAVVASYAHQGHPGDDVPGLTSELAAITVFLLGGMCVAGHATLAVALAVAVSAVLAYKQPLHGLVARIDAEELYAGIKLLIASFIVLPLLPDTPIDPWQALNPYKLWLLVVLISAISLLGYAAIRWLGPARGAALSGLTGGLVSSTAATLSLARASRTQPAEAHALAAGILLAWSVMFARVMLLVAVVHLDLLKAAWLPLAAMGGVSVGFALWHYRAGLASGAPAEATEMALRNPFSLSAAIRFGVLFAVVLLAVRVVQQQLPDSGLYWVAAVVGLVDTDAITMSLAEGARDGSGLVAASLALAVAALSNTGSKCVIAWAAGRGPLRVQIGVAGAAVLGAGALALSLG
jgi:uncharacterized membrane protein (DUF4010 family)